jgi:hypothetical protein
MPSPAPSSSTALALAVPGPDGKRWMFLSIHSNLGNLLRTSSPFLARTWQTLEEITSWMDELPRTVKAEILDREFEIVPLTITTAKPKNAIALVRTPTAPEPQAAEA